MRKKIISVALAFAMVLSLLPAIGLSAAAEGEAVSYRYPVYNKTDGSFYENASSGIKEWVETGSCTNYTKVTGSDTTWGESGQEKWYVVEGAVTINQTVTCVGDVRLILKDGANLTVIGKSTNAGINVSGANSLIIYGQSGGIGELHATGDFCAAGIGGGTEQIGSNITINGGIVTATGGMNGAGIGGAYWSAGSNITINDGTVIANSIGLASGIGGGSHGAGSNITINGGIVTATGGMEGAGIGGGSFGAGSNIIITGGTVKANGGNDPRGGGAGIGGGAEQIGSNITISGGIVMANGGAGSEEEESEEEEIFMNGGNGAGIGGGGSMSGGTNTGSNIKASANVVVKAGDTVNPTTIVGRKASDDLASIPTFKGKRYVVIQHEHSWSYSVANGALIATCLCDENDENCIYKDKDEANRKFTLSVTAPTDLVYNGSGKTMTVGTPEEQAAWEDAGLAAPTVAYYHGGSKLDSAPKNAGTYTAKISPAGVNATNENTATVEFTIAKRTWETKPTVSVNSIPVGKYSDNLYAPTNSVGITEGVTYYYNAANSNTGGTEWTAEAVNTLSSGQYYLYAQFAENENMAAVTTEAVPFTIHHVHSYTYQAVGNNKIQVICTGSNDDCNDARELVLEIDNAVYTGKSYVPAGVTRFIQEVGEDTAVTVSYKKGSTDLGTAPTNAGDYSATLTVGGVQVTSNFKILPKSVTKPTAGTGTYCYNGNAQTYKLTDSDDSVYYQIKDNSNKQTNAGSYDVVVELKDKTNTCWADGTSTDLTFTKAFTIQPVKIPEPYSDPRNFEADGTEKTYQAFYILPVNGYYSYCNYEGVFYQLSNNKQTAAGTYDVSVTPMPNYCWQDGTTTAKTHKFTISTKQMRVGIYYLLDKKQDELVEGYVYGRYSYDYEHPENCKVSTFYEPYLYNVPRGATIKYFACTDANKSGSIPWEDLTFKSLYVPIYCDELTFYMYAKISCPGYADYETAAFPLVITTPLSYISAEGAYTYQEWVPAPQSHGKRSGLNNLIKKVTNAGHYEDRTGYKDLNLQCFYSANECYAAIYDQIVNKHRSRVVMYMMSGGQPGVINASNVYKIKSDYEKFIKSGRKIKGFAPNINTMKLTAPLELLADTSNTNEQDNYNMMAEIVNSLSQYNSGLAVNNHKNESEEFDAFNKMVNVSKTKDEIVDLKALQSLIEENAETYNVTFDLGYLNEEGTANEILSTKQVAIGSQLEKPNDPEFDNGTFIGWYYIPTSVETQESNPNFTLYKDGTAWDFDNDVVTSDLHLTAVYASLDFSATAYNAINYAEAANNVKVGTLYSSNFDGDLSYTIDVYDKNTEEKLSNTGISATFGDASFDATVNATGADLYINTTTLTPSGEYIIVVNASDGTRSAYTGLLLEIKSNDSGSGERYNAITSTIPMSGDKGDLKLQVTATSTNATIKDVTASDLEKVGTGEKFSLDLTSLKSTVTGVTLPKTTIENIAASDAPGLEVKLPNSTVAEFDKSTLSAVADQAEGKNIQLVVNTGSKAESTLTAAQKETVKTMNNPLVLDAYLVSNGTRISDFGGGSAKLTVPYATDKPVQAWYVDADGSREAVLCTSDGETGTVTVSHFSHYVIETVEETQSGTGFVDVNAGDYFCAPVNWAAEKGITKGVNDTHFAPNSSCTRAQIVTFLWRAAGSPTPESTTCPFTDVDKDAYYYDAVLWAVENGITKGMTDTVFGVDNTCTRGQAVTFLYRLADGETAAGENPFDDVQSGDYYYDAVLWAVEKGITKGEKPTAFAPAKDCTRGQIVTFLYRDMAE